jgi:hypothetical protein
MSQRPQRTPVTVEDLLRLKRAERPDAEFWSKFEVELRQKQLAALVERRPWWQQLPLLVNRRAYLPIGATAVLTFTLVSLRYYSPAPVASLAPIETHTAVATSTTVEPRHDIVSSVQANEPRIAVPAVEEPAAVAHVQLSDELPAKTGELVPWSAPRATETPSARSIAANLAKLEQTEPDLANALIGGRLGTAPSAIEQTAARAVEMAGVATVSSRRNRLLASMSDRQFTPDPSAPEVVRERLARRLGDTELPGGWTRVGLKADRVSLKF